MHFGLLFFRIGKTEQLVSARGNVELLGGHSIVAGSLASGRNGGPVFEDVRIQIVRISAYHRQPFYFVQGVGEVDVIVDRQLMRIRGAMLAASYGPRVRRVTIEKGLRRVKIANTFKIVVVF